jgi:tetratricopeptide (TPR) repeat protein
MLGVTRIFKIGLRVAEWATPHVQNWHRERNLNRSEAHRHLAAGNWSEAEKYFQKGLEETHHSNADSLELMLGLAETQRRQLKLDDAERTASSAIAIAVREKNEAMHALALDELVTVQLDQYRFTDAEHTAREVIRLENARPKPDQARLASCSRKLALALERSERTPEAIEALRKALGHTEKAYGEGHAETAGHLHELGLLHRRHGDHDAAQLCLRRALGIHRALGINGEAGAASAEATATLYHLAASLEESGDLAGAATEFERMLALRERQVGANREETSAAQVRLAALHLRTGRVSSARELLIQALPALERKGGPMLAQAFETFASAEERSGREDQARLYREKAMIAAALCAGE